MTRPTAPRVFISYTHESDGHKAWVAKLATDLRRNGVEAVLDVWDLKLGSDVTAFMEAGIRDSDRVLLICTVAYFEKAKARKGGVGYEQLVVTSEIVGQIDTEKFVCVLRSGEADTAIPAFVRNRLFVDFREDHAYSDRLLELLRDLHTAPAVSKPPLGDNPFVGQPKERSSIIQISEESVDVGDGSKKPPLGKNPLTPEVMAALESPVRRRMPDTRMSLTHMFSIAGHEGTITVGLYPDGHPGEIFISLDKEGSTIGGLVNSLAALASLSLQYGVPLEAMIKLFAYQRFEPSGFTRNSDVRTAYSITDYVFRWLGCEFIMGYREATTGSGDTLGQGDELPQIEGER